MRCSESRVFLSLLIILFLASGGCSSYAGKTSVESSTALGSLKFLESYPDETQLDTAEFGQAWQEWPKVLASAKNRIDVASFYFSRMGDGKDAAAPAGLQDHLLPSLEALAQAGSRACDVRVLGDSKFYKTYPEALTWLGGHRNVESRHITGSDHWGGVMHAKYFVVDDHTLYVGSQNWDWRAMAQIRELGALVQHPVLASQLRDVFEMDWVLANSPPTAVENRPEPELKDFPLWADLSPSLLLTAAQDTCQAILAASPAHALPEGVAWDLPLILEAIHSAEKQVRLQLLSYGVTDRQNRFWPELDNALRAAASRKVKVQIILSNWAKARYSVPWLKSLASVPNLEVKFSNIPEHSLGFAPYSRVEHPKYLTVDGQKAWVGTSNWSRDYFYASRNVSLFLQGAGAVAPLDAFFEMGWNGPYTESVNPCEEYQPPKKY